MYPTVFRNLGRRVPHGGQRRFWPAVALWLLVCLLLPWAPAARAQGIDLPLFSVSRQEQGLLLDFTAQVSLSRAVEDAMQRGVPVYFVAQATVYRSRWYWRDERVARATRSWRLTYQPLTSSWRVSLGGLSQTARSAEEALIIASRAAGWKIAEPGDIDPGERYYVEFSYRLDANQLPRPMQLDLSVMSDWRISVERTLRLE